MRGCRKGCIQADRCHHSLGMLMRGKAARAGRHWSSEGFCQILLYPLAHLRSALQSRRLPAETTATMRASSPPFPKEQQLCSDLDGETGVDAENLPGWPCVPLSDRAAVEEVLHGEFYASDLEAVAPRLWIMSTQSSANVSPLHRQKIKGRNILITEDPRLHLVWIHDRIFVKPIPRYLLSHRFWEIFLLRQQQPPAPDARLELTLRAAKGYLRSYRYLIQRESDFDMAKQDHLRLVPRHVEWPEFCRFISNFDRIRDVNVSPRYHYGELRLSRLNFYAPFLFGKFHFQRLHGQYSDYFARLYGPVLFAFAVASTALSSMQVVLAVEQVSSAQEIALWSVCRWAGTAILVVTAAIALGFALLWLWLFCSEWVYAIKCRVRKRRQVLYQLDC
ncbi:hypothetical protein MAPG_02115 [Magnaporthiopsis poae ATCC 64411]|uniref:Subtilisin-like serine protease n=1 Tax=Magnaporthiopsis poae (strain ATCC 64411 / 73-15) TaxID=644358 RepID=A0A0C4DQH4_MAGP6|nr:hypothetical protein MAPG_02115 [Magnaporthiopsis poae ATCC 64411]